MSGYHFKSYSGSTTNGFTGMSQLHQPIVNNNNSTTIQVHHDSGGQPSSGSIIRIHSDSQQSLERLFNPHINETSVVPLRQRNLPSSFFNPTPSNGNSTTRLDGVPEQRVVNSANLHIRSTSSDPRPKANGLHMRFQSVVAPMTGLSVASSGAGSSNQLVRSNDTLSNSSTNCSTSQQATARSSSGFGGSNLTTTSSSSSNLLSMPSLQPMGSIGDPQHQAQSQFSSHQNQSNQIVNQPDHQLTGNVVVASGGFHNRNYSSPVVLTNSSSNNNNNNHNPLHHNHNHHLHNHHHHHHNHLQQAHHHHHNHSHHQQQQAYSGQTAEPMNTQDFGVGQAAPIATVQYPAQGRDSQTTGGCGFGAQTAMLSTSNTQLATAPSQMQPHVAGGVQCVSSANQMHNHQMHHHHHHHQHQQHHHHQLQPTEALNQQMANTSLNAPPTFQLLGATNEAPQQQQVMGGHNPEAQQQLVHNQQPPTGVVTGNNHCRFYSTPVAMNSNPFNQQQQQPPLQHHLQQSHQQQQQYSDYYGQR